MIRERLSFFIFLETIVKYQLWLTLNMLRLLCLFELRDWSWTDNGQIVVELLLFHYPTKLYVESNHFLQVGSVLDLPQVICPIVEAFQADIVCHIFVSLEWETRRHSLRPNVKDRGRETPSWILNWWLHLMQCFILPSKGLRLPLF